MLLLHLWRNLSSKGLCGWRIGTNTVCIPLAETFGGTGTCTRVLQTPAQVYMYWQQMLHKACAYDPQVFGTHTTVLHNMSSQNHYIFTLACKKDHQESSERLTARLGGPPYAGQDQLAPKQPLGPLAPASLGAQRGVEAWTRRTQLWLLDTIYGLIYAYCFLFIRAAFHFRAHTVPVTTRFLCTYIFQSPFLFA